MILVSALLSGATLAGCGQKGPLYLPTGDAAAGRASLPDTLRPGGPSPDTPATIAPGTAVNPANAASVPTGTANPIPVR